MTIPRVLLTGFPPFSNHPNNVSEEILREISISGIDDLQIVPTLLSVDEPGSREVSSEISRGVGYSAILHLGYSPDSTMIHLERFARNRYSMTVPDNSGRQIKSGLIVEDAPLILETIAPTSLINASLGEKEIVSWSEDAGGFVCNETYFRTLLSASKSNVSPPRVLFMHLPGSQFVPIEEQIAVVSIVSRCLCFSTQPELLTTGQNHA